MFIKLFFFITFLKGMETFTVIVVGPTGSGKSTLINRIMNSSSATVSHAQESCTQACSSYYLKLKHNKDVYLIDTPGFPDTLSAEKGIINYNSIVEEINLKKPDIILFLVKYGRWARENDILQAYSVIISHFREYGWYIVLGTAWPAVDVQHQSMDMEFSQWQESMYLSLQSRFKNVHNIAAFGTHKHARKELQRIISAKLHTSTSISSTIPTVTEKLTGIYQQAAETIERAEIIEYLTVAKNKLTIQQTTETTFIGSAIGTIIVPALLPFGLPMLGILALSTSVATWTGYNVFNTYYYKHSISDVECQYIATHMHNASLQYNADVTGYLQSLQEITGVASVNYNVLCELIPDKQLVQQMKNLHLFFNSSCTSLITNFKMLTSNLNL